MVILRSTLEGMSRGGEVEAMVISSKS
ncbi:uncharacterized protein G2W53_007737 [Senna tora]|uniref:Uncharacterized protein n=1 Tax=Senna tora TaxID=362788 RepID=A0A834X798_9FABA|nr:uncharacterized protein G2W53_007737 [Senna tora]